MLYRMICYKSKVKIDPVGYFGFLFLLNYVNPVFCEVFEQNIVRSVYHDLPAHI